MIKCELEPYPAIQATNEVWHCNLCILQISRAKLLTLTFCPFQILQWQDEQQGKPRRRWVLKGQAHSIHLPFLWRVFPTVEIVDLHRDPVAAMPAYLTYLAYSQGIFSSRLDLKDLGAWFTLEYDSFLHKAQSIREFHHDQKVTDVYFEDLVEDNLNVVKEVLDFSGEKLGAQDLESMKSYMLKHERYEHNLWCKELLRLVKRMRRQSSMKFLLGIY